MFPLLIAVLLPVPLAAQPFRPEIPKVWDDVALEAMQVPLAQLKYSPSRCHRREFYYKIPVMCRRSTRAIRSIIRTGSRKNISSGSSNRSPEIGFDASQEFR
jgi:hypothetical protein